MSTGSRTGAAIAPPNPWDPVVRLSHWLIAAAVIINGLLSEPGGAAHIWIGWIAMAVLFIRLVWGFIGAREARFGGLTMAEREVGMLALKGIDLAEIARLRGSAQGTVRAQMTRIYAKAGVSGRAQFAAWFVEELLGEGISQPAADHES